MGMEQRFIKIMYNEFKTNPAQKRLNIAVTPADIKLVKSNQQSSSDQLSVRYATGKWWKGCFSG